MMQVKCLQNIDHGDLCAISLRKETGECFLRKYPYNNNRPIATAKRDFKENEVVAFDLECDTQDLSISSMGGLIMLELEVAE